MSELISSPENEIELLQSDQISYALKYILKNILSPEAGRYFFLEMQKAAQMQGELLKREALDLQKIDILRKRYDRTYNLLESLRHGKVSPSTSIRKDDLIEKEQSRLIGQIIHFLLKREILYEDAFGLFKELQKVAVFKGGLQDEWNNKSKDNTNEPIIERLYEVEEILNQIKYKRRQIVQSSPGKTKVLSTEEQELYKTKILRATSKELNKGLTEKEQGLYKTKILRSPSKELNREGAAISFRVTNELNKEQSQHLITPSNRFSGEDKIKEVREKLKIKSIKEKEHDFKSEEANKWGKFLEDASSKAIGKGETKRVNISSEQDQLGILDKLPVSKYSEVSTEESKKKKISPELLTDLLEPFSTEQIEEEKIFLPGYDEHIEQQVTREERPPLKKPDEQQVTGEERPPLKKPDEQQVTGEERPPLKKPDEQQVTGEERPPLKKPDEQQSTGEEGPPLKKPDKQQDRSLFKTKIYFRDRIKDKKGGLKTGFHPKAEVKKREAFIESKQDIYNIHKTKKIYYSDNSFKTFYADANIEKITELSPISMSLRDGVFMIIWGELFYSKINMRDVIEDTTKNYNKEFFKKISKNFPMNIVYK